ncbi:hypothetical protein DFS34DRAFT_634574 [Phlyctochytrium arcticum]|nr:hypothetical protein DFS34DRAFT_634574 [Phlyctochytrium arcticum]
MVITFLVIWAPHTAKLFIVSFTHRPITAQLEMIISLLAVTPRYITLVFLVSCFHIEYT